MKVKALLVPNERGLQVFSLQHSQFPHLCNGILVSTWRVGDPGNWWQRGKAAWVPDRKVCLGAHSAAPHPHALPSPHKTTYACGALERAGYCSLWEFSPRQSSPTSPNP